MNSRINFNAINFNGMKLPQYIKLMNGKVSPAMLIDEMMRKGFINQQQVNYAQQIINARKSEMDDFRSELGV